MKRGIQIVLSFVILATIGCTQKTSEQLIIEGSKLSADNDFDGAVKKFDKVIAENPTYVDAYFERALANVRRDSFDLAVVDYTKIIELNPKPNDGQFIANLYFSRANVYYQNVQDTLACGDWKKACRQFGHTSACNSLRLNCKK